MSRDDGLSTRPCRLTQNEPLIVCEQFIVATRSSTLTTRPTNNRLRSFEPSRTIPDRLSSRGIKQFNQRLVLYIWLQRIAKQTTIYTYICSFMSVCGNMYCVCGFGCSSRRLTHDPNGADNALFDGRKRILCEAVGVHHRSLCVCIYVYIAGTISFTYAFSGKTRSSTE